MIIKRQNIEAMSAWSGFSDLIMAVLSLKHHALALSFNNIHSSLEFHLQMSLYSGIPGVLATQWPRRSSFDLGYELYTNDILVSFNQQIKRIGRPINHHSFFFVTLPGMRYCMFMASSLSLSFLMQTAASENRMEEQSAIPTPTQLTM